MNPLSLDDANANIGLYVALAKAARRRKDELPPEKLPQPSEKTDARAEEKPKPEKKEITPDVQRRYDALLSVGEECLEESELLQLVLNRPSFRLYDGFECSGRMHIAQGIFKALNVNTCTGAGGEFVFWVADFFALMNDKMGGDLEKIKIVGEYLIEVWKAAGMSMERVRFIWASADICDRSEIYSRIVADIARRFTVARLVKCCQIMGRLEGNLSAAQVLYPIMQCADVFFLQADVCQLGKDQRKVNVLARDYAALRGLRFKPIVLSHHMLFGLKQGQEKMSKSDPDSAIFMEDAPEDVVRKLSKAYCPRSPPEELEKNPCLDYLQYIVMKVPGTTFMGRSSFPEIKRDFAEGKITEEQLKTELAEAVNRLLNPVRAHFSQGRPKELLELLKQFKAQEIKDKEAVAAKELELQRRRAALAEGEEVEEAGAPVAVGDDATEAMSRRARREAAADAMPALRLVNYLEKKAQSGVRSSSGGARCVVVTAPPPPSDRARVALQDVLGCVRRLEAAVAGIPAEETETTRVVFLVEDLCAVCTGALADPPDAPKRKVKDDKSPFADVGKASTPSLEVDAYFTVLLGGIKNLARPSLFSRVEVVRQSELVASDPMNYWISVINVGRAFKLDYVMKAAIGSVDQEGARVGSVVEALMHVADLLAFSPVSRVYLERGSARSKLADLALDFVSGEFASKYRPLEPFLKVEVETPDVRMVANAEGDAEMTIISLADSDKEVAGKIKRAFCEEGNLVNNPVLHGILENLVAWDRVRNEEKARSGGPLLPVRRTPENGGDVDFQTVGEVAEAFGNKRLHPGDLKTAVIPMAQDVMKRARAGLPAEALKVLEACKKRLESTTSTA